MSKYLAKQTSHSPIPHDEAADRSRQYVTDLLYARVQKLDHMDQLTGRGTNLLPNPVESRGPGL